MVLGLRVVRGPDWNQGNKDGGINHVGTVSRIKSKTSVEVTWDMGGVTDCRVGGKNDIVVIDNATIGVIHEAVTCCCCNEVGISGILWRCTVCKDASLCSPCYFRDSHDTTHACSRIDYPGAKPAAQKKRSISQRTRALGMFPTATVIRGPNWEYGNQDGGAKKEGRVEDVITWGKAMTERDAVRVAWGKGSCNVYRLGYCGKVDVICKEEAPGPDFYPDHLGPLDMAELKTLMDSASVLKIGDKVCVMMSKSELKQLQEAHSNWDSKMEMVIGAIGEIKKFTLAGDIQIEFEEGMFTLNKAAIQKAHTYNAWDLVRVVDAEAKCQRLQRNHGGWDDAMKEVLGKVGTVMEIDKDGDVAVKFGDVAFVFNPMCLTTAKGEKEFVLKKVSDDSLYSTGSDILADDDSDSGSEKGGAGSGGQNDDDDDDDDEDDDDDDDDDADGVSQVLAGLLLLGQALQANIQTSATSDQELRKVFVQKVADGDSGAVKSLLQRKSDLLKTTYKNLTMLTLATHKGHTAVIGVLLDAGANINYTDDNQTAALLTAIRCEEEDAAKFLIGRKANVNMVNFQKRSALHFATAKNMIPTVKLLLQHGCDINAQDKDGDTALHDAIAMEKDAVTDILVANPNVNLWRKNKKQFNPLAMACFKGNEHATERLIAKMPGLATAEESKTDDNFYPLHIAAVNNHTEIAKILLTKGKADVNVRSVDNSTPLLLAARKGQADMTTLLLANGADVKAKDNDGDTALIICLGSRRQAGPLLLLLGMNPVAEENERVKVAGLLLKHGVDIRATNKKGQTALQVAWSPRVRDAVSKLAGNKDQTGGGGGATGRGVGGQQDAFSTTINECLLCRSDKADVCFLPCNHSVTCSSCCYRCRVCPVCQSPILQRRDKDGSIVLGDNCTIS